MPGELDNPFALIFGPDGHLYAGSDSYGDIYDQVLRFDGKSGTFIDTIVPKGGDVDGAVGLAFHDVRSGPLPTPGVPRSPRVPAFVTVIQEPTPNLGVRRDSVVSNIIVVTNRGKGDASNVMITMPFDPQTIRILDAHFSRAGDWVSELNNDSLVIRTGRLAHDDVITATVRLAIQPTAAEGAAVGQRLIYRWNDGVNGGQGRSNVPALVVGQDDVNAPFYPMAVETSKTGNNEYEFESNLFAPREPVALWYNTPDGQAVAVGQKTADEEGVIHSQLTSAGLTPGYYSMVAYGIWSRLTAAAPFQVP